MRTIQSSRVLILTILFLGIGTCSFCQEASNQVTDSGGLVKFSVFPFLYKQLQSDPSLWLGFHYENRFKSTRSSFNATLQYTSYTSVTRLNGVIVSQVPGNIDFSFIPQWRYYAEPHPYTGAYVQIFPVYQYRDHPAGSEKGSYFGGGAGFGYTFWISNRIRLEFNTRISYIVGNIQTPDYTTMQTITKRDEIGAIIFELNVGSLLRK